jgi:glycosyltransferase involved in cell wall biosynthesis
MNKGLDDEILALYERLSKTQVSPDYTAVQHNLPDLFVRDRCSKHRIGYTIFEMTGIPQLWVSPCNEMDEIWTGSDYSKNAFVSSGVKVPVHVLPHAIDIERFRSAVPWRIENKRAFTFLSVFDFTPRKAWQDLLRAYWTAFEQQDDVCLILKVFFSDFSEESRADIIRRILRYRESLKFHDRAPILIYGHDVRASDMPGLFKAADCYVGVSREGFGLPYAEAMAAGIATIGPEVGGTREFMNPENSLLVRYVGDERISDEMMRLNPMFDGLSWAKHDWEHLAEQMRLVVSDSGLRRRIADNGARDIAAHNSFDAVGRRIISLLNQVDIVS